MDDEHAVLYSSNNNELESYYPPFQLSDINYVVPTSASGLSNKIRVLNDKSTSISPGGDFTAAADQSSCSESEHEDLIDDHVSYKKSIENLRLESRTLLQRSPRREKLDRQLSEVLLRPKEDLTILKLLWEDRERIGMMISDLAEAKETILNLNSQILKQREKNKKMRNLTIKKIDALQERIEMMKAKEKYKNAENAESIRILNNKLSDASKETEESEKQRESLKMELTELAKVAQENKELREKLAKLKQTSKEFKKQEKDYLSSSQKRAKATQTVFTIEALADAENRSFNVNNNQGKRKLKAKIQRSEVDVGDTKWTRLHLENEKNIIRKKSKPLKKQKENAEINNEDELNRLNSNTSFPSNVEHESQEDDLIRELFFKF